MSTPSNPARSHSPADAVLRRESDFANRDFAPHADELEVNPSMFRLYTSPLNLWDWRQMSALQLGEVADKDLLDLGCGIGEESIYFAKLGARVTGIDISEVGVASLQRRIAHHGLGDRVKAFLMRADPTQFPDQSFDRVHGLGILHHIGIEPGFAEVWRVLRPGGVGVFLEPLGDSPVVETVKAFIMKHRLVNHHPVTEHEENLRWEDIRPATARFADVRTYPYHLLFRLRSLLPASAWSLTKRIDFALLALAPRLQRFAGAVVMRVRK